MLNQDLEKYKILVVDDTSIFRALIRSHLEEYGSFEVFEAVDAIDALHILTHNKSFQCIILDLLMPQMTGFDFINEMRKRFPKYKPPIIINSIVESIDSIMEGLKLGCYDYFVKPLKKSDLEVVLPLKIKNAADSYEMNLAIERKNQEFNQEMNLARKFQESILPNKIECKNVDIFYNYKPYIEIGGDFIDYKEFSNKMVFFIADISGHGVASAMISSLLKWEFNISIKESGSIESFIKYLNSSLLKILDYEMFLTCFIGEINHKTQKLRYINCAHPPAILQSKNKYSLINSTGMIVGMFDSMKFKVDEIDFRKGDSIFLCTDGAFEFFLDNSEQYGFHRLYEDVENAGKKPSKELVTEIYNKISDLSNKKFFDDILLCSIKKIK